ncbi:MAG: protease inhibitor I42 family protein [Dehalococcoidales bacterium]|nr:protease inhibitor I42 family protein [Dehalococcoidales bacterium]
MKKIVVFSLATLMLIPLLALGCGGGGGDQTIELSLDDFQAQNNIVKSVEVGSSGTLTVKLGSNPTTGYEWGDADISNTAVIAQKSHNYIEPEDTDLMGAPGTDVWVFDAKAAGSATITFSYSRPWEEGTPATYTLTINVTVK